VIEARKLLVARRPQAVHGGRPRPASGPAMVGGLRTLWAGGAR
jgi:hypothetical protein